MSSPVKSAQRVLELLEYFAEVRQPSSVGAIAQALGWPQSSTSVLLKGLAESGYFDHDSRTRLYTPNVRISMATAWVQEHMYSEHNLLRLMEGVLAKSGHTVMIGTRRGLHVRYLHVLQATREGRFLAKIGSLRSLFHSAAGKVLLTTMPEREVADLLRKANGLETVRANRMEFTTVRHEIESVRRQGYAISTGASMPGAAALAVLVPVARDRDPMSLSLGGPMCEIEGERDRLVLILKQAIEPIRQAVAS
jgi:DNA-binding IclR family transcriptional regulator